MREWEFEPLGVAASTQRRTGPRAERRSASSGSWIFAVTVVSSEKRCSLLASERSLSSESRRRQGVIHLTSVVSIWCFLDLTAREGLALSSCWEVSEHWLVEAVSPRLAPLQTWLILPVVICLSQRLSHACLSISFYTANRRMAH